MAETKRADDMKHGDSLADAPRVAVTPEGMIEEQDWGDRRERKQAPEERPWGELVASVLAGPPPEDDAQAADTPGPAISTEEAQADASADSDQTPPQREEAAPLPLGPIAVLAAAGLIVVAFWFMRGSGGPDAAADSAGGTGAPPAENQVAAQPTSAPPPAAVVAPVASPPPAPVVTAAPALAPQPTAAPTPPATQTPAVIHVADLDASTPGQKVAVKIYVQDAALKPVAGVTVTGQWSGAYSSAASCVTDATGSCGVRTQNVSGPGSVTFTVTSLSGPNNAYDSSANHDPDADSDGTSIKIAI